MLGHGESGVFGGIARVVGKVEVHGRVGRGGLGDHVDKGFPADLGWLGAVDLGISIEGAIFVPVLAIFHEDAVEGPGGFGLGHPEGIDRDFFLGRFSFAASFFGFR